MDSLGSVLAAVIVGYLVGGIPFGILVARLAGGPDPRTIGSGRIGGANVSRAVGARWAALSGCLDVAKAVVAVLMIRALLPGPITEVAAALAAVVGHSRSPYVGFRGGRGVAPAFGGLLVLVPPVVLVVLPVFAVVLVATRISSLGSLLGSAAGGLATIALVAATSLPPAYAAYGIGAAVLIWAFHHDNIRRLLAGTERRLGGPSRQAVAE